MVLEVKNVVKRYKKNVAVNDVSLEIKEKETFGLLGPNGAGKSTLMNTMLGLLKNDKGSVKIFGEEISKASNGTKQLIGYVPQDFAFFNELNAYDNVMYWARLYGKSGAELQKSVKEALEFVGLWDRRKDKAKNYSGGMKRRLNIACAIVHKPKVLFMDEPTVGVDPQSRNNILEAVRELNKNGTTVIYTSHYMEEIEALCSRVAIMDFGKIIAQGTIDELIDENVQEETISFHVGKDVEKAKRVISMIDPSIVCETDGETVLVTVQKKKDLLNRIMEEITKNEIHVNKLEVEKSNLELVFLKLTGKTLRD